MVTLIQPHDSNNNSARAGPLGDVEERGTTCAAARAARPGIGDAPYVSRLSDASRSGESSGWFSIMPIIVGTIIVWVTACCSMIDIAPPGSYSGMNVVDPPVAGVPMIPPIDAAWNIGV